MVGAARADAWLRSLSKLRARIAGPWTAGGILTVLIDSGQVCAALLMTLSCTTPMRIPRLGLVARSRCRVLRPRELERQGGSRWGRRERCSAEAPCPTVAAHRPAAFWFARRPWSCGSLRLHLRGFVFGSLSVGLRQLHWWPPHCDTGPPPPAPTRPHAAPTAVASRAGPPLHTQPSLCPRLVLALVACRVRAPRLGWTRVRRASPPARMPRLSSRECAAPRSQPTRSVALQRRPSRATGGQCYRGQAAGRGDRTQGLPGEAARGRDRERCMRVRRLAPAPACRVARRAARAAPPPCRCRATSPRHDGMTTRWPDGTMA